MPPALSADPISPSTIERPLRPPQRSLTREDTGVIAFHLNPLSFTDRPRRSRPSSAGRRPALGTAKRRACRTHGVGVLRRDYEACAIVGLVVDIARRAAAGLPGPLPFSFSAGVAGAAGAGFVLVRPLNPPSSLLDLPFI